MAATSDSSPIDAQDLFIFTNGPNGGGALYYVPVPMWRTLNCEVPGDSAVSIRDMLANGAAMIAFPMDDPFQLGRLYYAAHLPVINITHPLTGSAKPGGTSDKTAVTQPEAGDSKEAPVDFETPKANDLYLLAPEDTSAPDGSPAPPILYRLSETMYQGFPNPYQASEISAVWDMLAHGTVLAAMPPNAGTLCYVISLASLASTNPAYGHR